MESLFADVNTGDREDLMRRGRRRVFSAGDKVFWQGDPGDTVHLVLKGSFAASVASPTGQTMIMGVFRRDELFGELALLGAHARRNATVVALERSETMAVDAPAFEAWRSARPQVERRMIAALARRVQDLTDQMLDAVFLPVEQRVARRLLVLHDAIGRTAVDGWIRIRQEELAAFSGASRPAVNRALGDFAVQGVLEQGRGRLRILSRPMLVRAAGQR